MRPRQPADPAQVDGRHLTPLAIFVEEALLRKDRPAEPVELLPRGDPDHPVIARPLPHLVGKVTPLDLVDADHAAIRPAFGKQPPLGREITAGAPVPVEMIGRQIGEDRHIRRQRAGKIGLIGRQLDHHHLAVMRRLQREHAGADIAAHLRGPSGRLQDVMDQRRGGRFAVRAGDGDDTRHGVEFVPVPGREAAEEEPDIVVDRHALFQRPGDDRVRLRIEMRNAGRGDQGTDPLPGILAAQVSNLQPLGLGPRAGFLPVIPDNDMGAACLQCGGGRLAGATETQNGDGLAGNTLDGDHGFTLGCRAQIAQPASCFGTVGRASAHRNGVHRSFSVDSPIRARISAMIQKRITIWLSFQPFFSKWWWIGAIRKTRLPVFLK